MNIIWTKGARENLNQIEEYIGENNKNAAVDVILKIIKTVAILAENPAMGKNGRIFNTRELIISNTPYIVPYKIKNKHIEILRVLHSKMQ